MRIDFDGSQRRVNELAGAQSSAIAEVDHEAKPLGSARLPAVRPLQTVGDRPQELPLALGEHPRRIQVACLAPRTLMPANGLVRTYRCSISHLNIELRTDSA